MNYCIYLRKSRSDAEAESHGEGETLARHESALLEFAQKRNLPITKIYREIVSGDTIASRPEMQQLLNNVEENLWDGVLVMEVERLARGDSIDQGIVAQAFKYSNTLIITPGKTYDPNNEFDEEYFEFGLFMSRREYKTITRRMQQGRKASVKEGKYGGAVPPYGYNKVKLKGEKGNTLEIREDQAEAIRIIFEQYAAGEGKDHIAHQLNNMGIPTATGIAWNHSLILNILRNPAYVGYVRWGYRKTQKTSKNGNITKTSPRQKEYILEKGRHTPIVSQEIWDAVQARLDGNQEIRCGKHKPIQNPFAGLVVCDQCGKIMQRRPHKQNSAKDALICTTYDCPTIGSQLPIIENAILRALADWAISYQVAPLENAKKSLEQTEGAIQRCQKEIENLKRQQEKAYNLVEQGIYTVDLFLERNKSFVKRLTDLESSLQTFQKDKNTLLRSQKQRLEQVPKINSILKSYKHSQSAKEKNDLLKSVISKVVYHKTIRGITDNDLYIEVQLKVPEEG